MEMQLQKTKYYTFQAGQQRPSIRELIYEVPHRVLPIAGRAIMSAITTTF
jgi:hypothetical protein